MSDIYSEIDSNPDKVFLNENLKANFFSLQPNAATRVVLETAIRKEKISATEAMVFYIQRLFSEDDLYAISIAIREGADVNVYVKGDITTGGSMHIIAYLHTLTGKILKHLFELALMILMAAGSSPLKEAFALDPTEVSLPVNMVMQRGESVLEWITSKGLDDFIRTLLPDLKKSMDRDTSTLIGLLSGRLDYVDLSKKLSEGDAITVIRSRANSQVYKSGTKIIELTDYFPRPSNDMDSRVMIDAIANFDRKAVLHYVSRGKNLSYALTNVLLLECIAWEKVPTLRHILGSMLIDCVNMGLIFDSDQQALCTLTGNDLYAHVMKVYSIPHWKKYCIKSTEYENKISEKLHHAAYSLGFSGESHQLCGFLQNIFMSDSEGLSIALSNRQKARIGSRYGYVNEFTTTTPPILNVANLIGNIHPYDYVDDYIVFYRDGEHKTWAWTSENFQVLLKSKRNPSSGKMLPDFVLHEVSDKLLRIADPKNPLLWKDLIDIILSPDVIQNTESDKQVSMMLNDLLTTHGISNGMISNLNAMDLANIVCSVKCVYRLENLTDAHAFVTFAYLYNYYMEYNQMAFSNIILSLQHLFNEMQSNPQVYSPQYVVSPQREILPIQTMTSPNIVTLNPTLYGYQRM